MRVRRPSRPGRTWVREADGELVWVREADGRLTVSQTMPVHQSQENSRELTRGERLAWHLVRRTPKRGD